MEAHGTAAVASPDLWGRGGGPSLPGRVHALADDPRGSLTRARRGTTAVSRADGQPPTRARMRNRETPMANGESGVGADAPAGGFVQLLTPDGDRVDSVTT